MKPIFVACFLLIMVSSSTFVVIYTYWREVVEANPAIFVAGLLTTVVISMLGMMHSLLSNSTVQPQRYQ